MVEFYLASVVKDTRWQDSSLAGRPQSGNCPCRQVHTVGLVYSLIEEVSGRCMKSLKNFCIVVIFVSASTVSIADGSVASPRTGALTLSYTTGELLGDVASRVESAVPRDEVITWEIYVPGDYRPDNPAGLFVFVSPISAGRMPIKWRSVMDENNLIWIAANKSGNRVVVSRRMLFAVLAVLVAERNYSVDTQRLYISGFSGGGKVASRIAESHAQTFKGGFFIGGTEVWKDEPPSGIESMKSNHYVFLCGSSDQALRSCEQAFRAYRAQDIENTKLMVIRGMGHNTPDASNFAKAIAFLDSPGTTAE
jgi:predicted esterase